MNQLAVVSAQTSRPTIIGASPACFPVGALSAGSAAKRVYHAIPELHETGTANRLRLAGRRLNIEARRVEATVEAFHFLQMLRLRQQESSSAPLAANRVAPELLNEVDRRMLKEAFRQARSLQQRLRETWHL
ncbi:MAG: hypothetical protein E6H48_14225 [Betaproteobacteria bacterium]|nr:MAG: hypothetical protein E6H48_14225 [Betaproteobacteria bacterium]